MKKADLLKIINNKHSTKEQCQEAVQRYVASIRAAKKDKMEIL